MNYSPDAKALVYSELSFVATVTGVTNLPVNYDMDALFDEVSEAVYALFVGEPVQQFNVEVVRQAQAV